MMEAQSEPILSCKTIHRGPEQSAVFHYDVTAGKFCGQCVLKRWQSQRLHRGDNVAQPFAELRMMHKLSQHPCFTVPVDMRTNESGLEVYYQFCGDSVQQWQQHAVQQQLDVLQLAQHVGVHLLLALRELRALGIVHRDIKPGNVLMDRWLGSVHLADFGLATLEERARSSFFFAGTDYACIPVEYCHRDTAGAFSNLHNEAACRRVTTCAIDMYQTALLLYVLLVGMLPRQLDPARLSSLRNAAAVEGLLDRVASFDWRGQLQLSVGCPQAREFLEACLASDPERRPTPEEALHQFAWFRDVLPAAEQQLEAQRSTWAATRAAARLSACYVMMSGLQHDIKGVAAEMQAAEAAAARKAAGLVWPSGADADVVGGSSRSSQFGGHADLVGQLAAADDSQQQGGGEAKQEEVDPWAAGDGW